MVGGYIMTVTGTLKVGYPTSGSIGSFDFGGSKGNVLLQTYGLQGNPLTKVNWMTYFFTGSPGYNEDPWGWLYTYSGPGTQPWCNNSVISQTEAGDIVTAAGVGVPEFGVPAALVASLALVGLLFLRKYTPRMTPKV